MEKTKIQAIAKSKIIDYGSNEIINFWLKLNPQPTNNVNTNKNQILDLLKQCQESVVCIQTEKIEDSSLIKEIFATCRRNRVYILTNDKPDKL